MKSVVDRPSFFKKKNMAHSNSFIIILQFYFELHQVNKHDMLRFQLLNKRCYNTYIPKLLREFRFDTPPCNLGSFEPSIQYQIQEKKEKGFKQKTGNYLTLQIDTDFSEMMIRRRYLNYDKKAEKCVEEFMNNHPKFAEHYIWTGEYWLVNKFIHEAQIQFKFESKNHSFSKHMFY